MFFFLKLKTSKDEAANLRDMLRIEKFQYEAVRRYQESRIASETNGFQPDFQQICVQKLHEE